MLNEATEAFRKASAIDNKSAAAYSALGLVYCAQGKLDDAHEQYLILQEIDSELADDLVKEIKRLPPVR